MGRDYDDYNEFESKRNSYVGKLIGNLSYGQVTLIVIVFFLGWYLVNQGTVSKNLVLIVIAGIVILILIFGMKKIDKKQPIPENVAKIIAKRQIERKIGAGDEIPTGSKIHPKIYCRLIHKGYYGGDPTPYKWEIGFCVDFPNVAGAPGVRKYYKVILHPYEGYCMGIVDAKGGFDGNDEKDIVVVLPEFYSSEEKKE